MKIHTGKQNFLILNCFFFGQSHKYLDVIKKKEKNNLLVSNTYLP
jgi:hypothetical protein